MPFDPISLGIAGAGALFDFIKGRQAQNSASVRTRGAATIPRECLSGGTLW